MAWNIGEELGIGKIEVANAVDLGLKYLQTKTQADLQRDAARAQNETQSQTMKFLTVAVIIFITMYAIKRAA